MTGGRRPDAPLRRLGSRVSRRGLLGAGVLAGVLAASGVPLQARTRGGVLRLGLSGPLPRGDAWDRAPAALAVGAVYDTLTEIGPTGELRGELALAWEAAPDAATWRLALRRDARFHDGRPLDSADVAASLLRHRSGPSGWALGRLAEVETDGPHALRVALAEADPDFPLLLAEPGLVIGPDGRFDGVGTGLYRVAEDQPADRLRLDRMGDHWKDGRAGWFEAVEALHLPDSSRRLEALAAGEVDVAGALAPELVAEAQEAGLAVTAVPGNRQLHVALPAGAPEPLRRLVARAVDRAALALAWGGSVAADHPLGPLHPSLAPPEPPPFEPEAARALASQALAVSSWEGGPTEDATFRKALAGPWAPLRDRRDLLHALDEARRAEGEERAARYRAAQAICTAAAPVVVAAHIPTVIVHGPNLRHGGAVSPLGSFDGGRLPERWWFA